MFRQVAIIGLGLIGGSIGLALRKTHAARRIVGYDQNQVAREYACASHAIDQAEKSPADVVQDADLVVLATPVGAIRAILRQIAPFLAPGTVVTDVASTKAEVLHWAAEILPESVTFVGGHPMAGKEVSGIEASDAMLFHRRIYCLTPTAQTSTVAIKKVCSLIEVLGAQVRFLDAVEHDSLVAGVSHLPFLASVALMNTLTEDSSWPDAAQLAANGFRDISRLAAGSPEMYRDICLTNSRAIVQRLDDYIKHLSALREKVATQEQEIDTFFDRARTSRIQWQAAQYTDLTDK